MGSWISNAVSCVAKLGIPDLVHAEAKSAHELAREIGARPDALYRFLRATASAGVLMETPDGKFSETPMSDALRKDAVPNVRAIMIMNSLEWHNRGWENLDYSVRTGKTAIEKVYGQPLFEFLRDNPEIAENFNDAMTSMSTGDGPTVAASCRGKSAGMLPTCSARLTISEPYEYLYGSELASRDRLRRAESPAARSSVPLIEEATIGEPV